MITFNGTNLETTIPGFAITDIGGRGALEQDIETVTVPGKPGTYFLDRSIPAREIPVSFEITCNSLAEVRTKTNQLNAILNVVTPVPISFSDELNKTYYGIPRGKPSWSERLFIITGSIVFYCADPNKYGPENTANHTSGAATVNAGGNEESKPITTVNVSGNVTHITFFNSTTGQLNMLGMPNKQSETPTAAETSIMINTGSNLTGWTAPASTEDAPVLGTLSANGDFYSTAYGTDGSNWHGPSMKTSLASSVQDFRIDVGCSMTPTGNGQAGGIIVSLLDGQNNPVAKLQLFKHHGSVAAYYASLQAGKNATSFRLINEQEYKRSSFNCILRLYRVGTSWTAQIYEKVNGVYQKPYTIQWTDKNNIATAVATQVQIQLLQRTSFPVVDQKIHDINIYRQNSLTNTQVPYVAGSGDVIVFDHEKNIITKNGIDVTEDKAFIGEYFPLVPGGNTLIVEPVASISSATTKWKDAWR